MTAIRWPVPSHVGEPGSGDLGYEGDVIVCPCHGGEFSAETGEVIAGPPPSGLAPKKVLEAGGQIYAVPS